jgi:hypothetical protein
MVCRLLNNYRETLTCLRDFVPLKNRGERATPSKPVRIPPAHVDG